MTAAKDDNKEKTNIPNEELYYDPRRVAKNVIERETDPDTSGVGMARDAQREQVKSAELTRALKMREQLEQTRDVDFEGLVDRLNGRDKSRRTNEDGDKQSILEKRKDAEHLRTYEGEPAPDGTDHVVGVDWYNNKTVTLDDRYKTPEQLEELQRARVEQGAIPGTKKDTADTPADLDLKDKAIKPNDAQQKDADFTSTKKKT